MDQLFTAAQHGHTTTNVLSSSECFTTHFEYQPGYDKPHTHMQFITTCAVKTHDNFATTIAR
eukprot:2464287-Amphidinium_carterae.1